MNVFIMESVSGNDVWVKDIMRNFHPFKVVGRGSETQLQKGANLNVIAL